MIGAVVAPRRSQDPTTWTNPADTALHVTMIRTLRAMDGDDARMPTIVLFTASPGTGKTTLAELTAARLDAPVFGWDWAMAAMTS